MDRMVYVAMTGAKESMLAQAVHTHNLANANTPGFRAELAALRSQPVLGPGHASRVYAMTERPGIDFAFGSVQQTGRDLDVAVKGEGWIAVQTPDQGEAYTRAGDLRLTPNGMLTTAAGQPVLGDAGPIAIPPVEKIEIGADGTISIRPRGQGAATLAVVNRIKLVNPPVEELYKGEDGLLRMRGVEILPPDGQVRLVVGALEGSNVNTVEAMVSMIERARHFEMQVKMMHMADTNDRAATDLMRIST